MTTPIGLFELNSAAVKKWEDEIITGKKTFQTDLILGWDTTIKKDDVKYLNAFDILTNPITLWITDKLLYYQVNIGTNLKNTLDSLYFSSLSDDLIFLKYGTYMVTFNISFSLNSYLINEINFLLNSVDGTDYTLVNNTPIHTIQTNISNFIYNTWFNNVYTISAPSQKIILFMGWKNNDVVISIKSLKINIIKIG